MKKLDYPGWRTALFIPVHIEKFVAKAHTRGADAYILDLEDSVPLEQKAEAREYVVPAAKTVSQDGAAALVRINLDERFAMDDVVASVSEHVSAIVVPKVESADQLRKFAAKISKLEQERNIPQGHTAIIAMIESVDALPKLDEIASADPRVVAMTLGSEDFSATAGMQPLPQTLLLPNQVLAFACRRANIMPLGFPGSIADYSDIDAFTETVKFAKQLGFVGAFCIHPKQVEVINAVLTPSAEEVEHAEGLLAAFEAGLAAGKGAVEYKGKMIDLPVVERARELLRNAKALA
ncbi:MULTISPECIES: CoA ester lyase [unclassified Oleiphilus]|uniref:HpcH/HpaI aldolase/citrate lyase family protein n=1 Tax=unclassified Oleiphilus TaxID=2631174 RepID=UPI0007C2221B|nr:MULTISPECIES: CoA ester lyase [unclassified Oleiphilus]KZY29208.1 citrate lyase [Oleiphilus sp. HI0043]KZZ67402.1 citrate lyase [Oleiphilus sp. HI0128]